MENIIKISLHIYYLYIYIFIICVCLGLHNLIIDNKNYFLLFEIGYRFIIKWKHST